MSSETLENFIKLFNRIAGCTGFSEAIDAALLRELMCCVDIGGVPEPLVASNSIRVRKHPQVCIETVGLRRLRRRH